MKAFLEKLKKNKGFSLVEVLVAMAVLAAISIPLIRSFVLSANVNKNAKRLQNATDIAQDISEYFTEISLHDLHESYKDNTDIRENYLFDADKGIVVFQNIGNTKDSDGVPYYEGEDKEDFYVTVVLDANEYSDVSSGGIKDINEYLAPELGDLFSVDTVTAFSQFTKYDGRIKTALKRAYADIPSDIEYSDIQKTVDINIEQEQSTVAAPKVHYTFSITVTYTYCNKSGNDYIKTDKALSYHFVVADDIVDGSGEIPSFYILYTPFDTHDDTHTGLFARDEMFINFRKGEFEEEWEKPVNLYIVQQDVGVKCKGLDESLIYIYSHKDIKTQAKLKYPLMENLNIFSNVDGWQQNVTQGATNMIKLFKMSVYIWYDKKDENAINAYLDKAFVPDNVYTTITTIKEEQ